MTKPAFSVKEFNQKKINHVFHYTPSFENLLKILQNGFVPSYCKEEIGDTAYLIPMVSFCNISLKDVELYMRYGKYGIGLSIEWAIKNRISPVIYFHKNSPFNQFYSQINHVSLLNNAERKLKAAIRQAEAGLFNETEYDSTYGSEDGHLLQELNNITVPTLQFFKFWKTTYRNKEVITYQEREWRFIPELKVENRIIHSSDNEFINYNNKKIKPKPHLPKYSLKPLISDLKYIIIREENQRLKIIDTLNKIFGDKKVTTAIIEGKLMILTDEQIKNDF